MTNLRIGNGFDVHRFAPERDLILGGVKLDYHLGLAGHSDADVLVHAVIDALLGATNLGDIGKLFPDTDPRYKNINSILLLQAVGEKIRQKEVTIINIDSVVVCDRPKIGPHTDAMKNKISAALDGLDIGRIGIKGKTTEGLGFTGRGEGIAVYSVALVEMD